MKTFGPETLRKLGASPYRHLSKELDRDRAIAILDELGFLGVVDLVGLLASVMTGSLSAENERFIVKIKKLRKPKVVPEPEAKG